MLSGAETLDHNQSTFVNREQSIEKMLNNWIIVIMVALLPTTHVCVYVCVNLWVCVSVCVCVCVQIFCASNSFGIYSLVMQIFLSGDSRDLMKLRVTEHALL